MAGVRIGITYADIFASNGGFAFFRGATKQDHVDHLVRNADWIDKTFILKDPSLDLSRYLRPLPEESIK